MSEHTPGPWRKFRYAGSDFGICRDTDGSKTLAIVRDETDTQLIATAQAAATSRADSAT